MAATLLNTHFLCSDFNVKNLIGVSEDIEGHVLVTCRGVVKQYSVSDQKQIHSWTTKTWHPFTSAAVCDPATNNIVAVINHSAVSQWNHTEDDIDKVKRENFETPIYQLIVSGGAVYVVFTSGAVEKLDTALKSRKEARPGCVGENETITYAALDKEEDVGVLAVRNEKDLTTFWKFHLSGKSPPVSCKLVHKNRLTGICLLSARLFTLWSDGSMHCLNLHSDPVEKFPGRHYSTVTAIDAAKNTKILPVASSHIALVGADIKNEGSTLLLWDVKFAMVTSTRKLKMYHDPPLSWVSSVGIIIVDGSLSNTPYVIAESTLATVFGYRMSKEAAYPAEICYGWDATVDEKKGVMQLIYGNKSEKLVEILSKINQLSLSESILVGTVIEHLIEAKELLLLHEVIMKFEDIPESCLIKVLQCYLGSSDSSFDGLLKYPPMQMEVKSREDDEVVKCPFGPGKAFFINAVLAKPHTDIQLTKELHKLSFEDSLCLIQYLYFLILAGEVGISNVLLCRVEDMQDLTLAEVSEWLSLLLDTKYHQLVMTSQVNVHRLLLSCFTRITDMHKFLHEVINLEPLIKRVVDANSSHKQENISRSGYSLERLVITR